MIINENFLTFEKLDRFEIKNFIHPLHLQLASLRDELKSDVSRNECLSELGEAVNKIFF